MVRTVFPGLTSGGPLTVGGNATVAGTLAVTGAASFTAGVTQKPNVISGQGATRVLAAAEQGSLCLFDRAAGIVYTLPTPAAAGIGAYFDFMTTVTITSNAAEVDTDAGTTFIGGSIVNVKTDLTTLFVIANGTSHVKIASNGTTTGGIAGSAYRLTCVSATRWLISGEVLGSGAIATPMA